MSKADVRPLDAYPNVSEVPTRWMDNDVYGHVNNVVYYSYFDTAVNRYLIHQGVLDIHNGDVIGLVVKTSCNYMASLSFPEVLNAGIGVSKIGNSSVTYEIGLFGEGSDQAAAQGQFVHVYVDKEARRPVSLPGDFRQALEKILID